MDVADQTEVGGADDALAVMSQFMDVITTYKCKGCDFVCYKQEDLILHVKSEHLPHAVTDVPDQPLDQHNVVT